MKLARSLLIFVFAATAGFALPSPAWALSPESFVVKLTSWKDQQKTVFGGSGVLFQTSGSLYVLTSEHVVLHDNDGAHHQFQLDGTSASRTQDLTYVASDWGMGLALMRVSGHPALDLSQIPTLDSLLKDPHPQPSDPAMSVGFPIHSASLLVDPGGTVASVTDASVILADVENLLEIQNAHGEFGMSGGAVVGGDGSVLGILSHETPDPAKKVLYAIPVATAALWARNFIQNPDAKPALVRTSRDELMAIPTVRNGHLILSWEGCDAANFNLPAVQLDYDNDAWHPGPTPPTNTFTGGFWDKMYAAIAPFLTNGYDDSSWPSGCVTAFRPRDIENFNPPPAPNRLQSLVEFFRSMRDPNLQPLARFNWQGQREDYLYIEDYKNAAGALSHDRYDLPAPEMELSRRLSLITAFTEVDPDNTPGGIGDVVEKYPVQYLSPDDLDRLLRDPVLAPDWARLKKANAAAYQRLLDDIAFFRKILSERSI